MGPIPRDHAPFDFDQSDEYGLVHTTLPPEQVIPPRFTDPLWLRGDFNGVTLDLTRWTAEELPFLVGANSTPLAMLMTPMLPLYSRYWQNACLTEHAERGYDDFCISHEPWNQEENGRVFSAAEMVAWCRYVKSWGFRTVLWHGGRPPETPNAYIHTLFDSGVVDFWIHGKEVNSQMSSEDFDASLAAMDAYVGGRVPIGAHFSPDNGRNMGYPQSAPPYLTNWSPYDGRVHLMQQVHPYASAGLQGASMYYGRKRVNLGVHGGDGGEGPGAPNSRVIAFETSALAQLYGDLSETDGCRRAWELVCGPRNDPRVRPVSGSMNGLRQPNGSPA